MKFSEAKEIGIGCGLENDAEFYNNIIIHCINLFAYEVIDKELKELRKEAEILGLEFCRCGCAKIKNKCYMCENFRKLRRK